MRQSALCLNVLRRALWKRNLIRIYTYCFSVEKESEQRPIDAALTDLFDGLCEHSFYGCEDRC